MIRNIESEDFIINKCKTCDRTYTESITYKKIVVCPICGNPDNTIRKRVRINHIIYALVVLLGIFVYIVSWLYFDSHIIAFLCIIPLIIFLGIYTSYFEKRHSYFFEPKGDPEIQEKFRQQLLETWSDSPNRQKSYVDEATGDIVLFSRNYPENGTSKWIVSNKTVTIFENNSSRSIPFSLMFNLTIKNDLFLKLSFEITGTPTMLFGATIGNKKEYIILHHHDFQIAKKSKNIFQVLPHSPFSAVSPQFG